MTEAQEKRRERNRRYYEKQKAKKEASRSARISDMALARSRQKTGGEVPNIFAPAVPPKSVGPGMAADSAFTETMGWALGGLTQATGVTGFLGYPVLAELAQRPEYRRISEIIAMEMTRRWVRLKADGDDDKSDKIKAIETAMDRLHVRDVFREAVEQDGFFGRGHIFLDFGVTDDRDELRQSMGDGYGNLSKLKTPKGGLRRLRSVEAVWCYPSDYNASDPLKPDWFKPSVWYVQGKEVHATRLLTIIGREVPDLLKPAYSFGGLSLSQMAKPYVDNWLRTRQSVADLISSFSVFVLKTNLAEKLTMDPNGDALFKRADFFNNLRDNRGLMLTDKELEDFANVSTSLATLDALQAQTQEHMASVSGIPLVKLLGIQPAGLNASSEGELECFYTWINALQESMLTEPLRTVLGFVQLSLFGEVDPAITFAWEPLKQVTEMEAATIRKTNAETGQVLIAGRVITSEEERQRIASDDDSIYDSIDVAAAPGEKLTPVEKATVAAGLTGAIVQAESSGLVDTPIAMEELRKLGMATGVWTSITEQDVFEAKLAPEPPEPDMSGGQPGPGGGDSPGTDVSGGGERGPIPPIPAQDADFKEDDHPRDKGGKFTKGGGWLSGLVEQSKAGRQSSLFNAPPEESAPSGQVKGQGSENAFEDWLMSRHGDDPDSQPGATPARTGTPKKKADPRAAAGKKPAPPSFSSPPKMAEPTPHNEPQGPVERGEESRREQAAKPNAGPLTDQILRASVDIAGDKGRRVLLSDLRDRLPDASKQELDAALIQLQRSGRAVLYKMDGARSQADEQAALHIAGEPRHILWVRPDAEIPPAPQGQGGAQASPKAAHWNKDLADNVLRKAIDIAGGETAKRVLIKDIKKQFSGVPKEDIDEAMKGLQREGRARLYRLDNTSELTPEDHSAAVHIAGEPRHILWVRGTPGGRDSRTFDGGMDAGWDEDEHPRDEDGKFSSGSGRGGNGEYADLKPSDVYFKLADAEDTGGVSRLKEVAQKIAKERPDLAESVIIEASDLGYPNIGVSIEEAPKNPHHADKNADKNDDDTIDQPWVPSERWNDGVPSKEEAAAALDNDVVPNGWAIHGRNGSDSLSTGYVTQMSYSTDVARQYSGKNGSIWYLKPNDDAKVLDFTSTGSDDMMSLRDEFMKSFKDGDFPDQESLPKDKEEAWEEVSKNFAPENIVNSAAAYDNDKWVEWLLGATNASGVVTPDGAVAMDLDQYKKVRAA